MDMLFCSRGARSDGCGVVSQLEIGIGLDLGFLVVFLVVILAREESVLFVSSSFHFLQIAGRGKFNESQTKLFKLISINCFSCRLR
jgi:hypothetical protein